VWSCLNQTLGHLYSLCDLAHWYVDADMEEGELFEVSNHLAALGDYKEAEEPGY
jgi:hypothetical protein